MIGLIEPTRDEMQLVIANVLDAELIRRPAVKGAEPRDGGDVNRLRVLAPCYASSCRGSCAGVAAKPSVSGLNSCRLDCTNAPPPFKNLRQTIDPMLGDIRLARLIS